MEVKYNLPNIGDKFGDWEVIDNTIRYIYPTSTTPTRYCKGVLVRCPHGVIAGRTISALCRGDTKGCVQCGGEQKYKGIGDLSASYVNSVQLGARERNLEFNVSLEYLWALYNDQNRKCALSGMDITLDPQYSTHYRQDEKSVTQTASLDRIDNNLGYIEGNVQWLHKKVNLMKNSYNQEEFVDLCELISKQRKPEPRTRVIIRLSVEGIHRWAECPIEEVSYLRQYHRHIFNVIGKAYVTHSDRDIEFIQAAHDIRQYLYDNYYNEQYKCLFFNDKSCEMLADEIVTRFKLYECEVNEDGEGGAIVKNYE
ncbi:MAG: hypothetical protein QXL17_02705 [Candidatus Thermoplasmatota archaeon]